MKPAQHWHSPPTTDEARDYARQRARETGRPYYVIPHGQTDTAGAFRAPGNHRLARELAAGYGVKPELYRP